MPLAKQRNRVRMRRTRVQVALADHPLQAALGRMTRDRDALRAHLAWHHESVTMPDIGTVVERLQVQVRDLQTLLTQHQADHIIRETQEVYEHGL